MQRLCVKTLCAVAALGLPALAQDLQSVNTVEGGTLAFGESVPFHHSLRPITNARLVGVAGSDVSVALWDEGPVAMYAITRAGSVVGRVREVRPIIRLRHDRFDPRRAAPQAPAMLAASPDSTAWIVQFHTKPIEAYRAALRDLGATVHQFTGDQGHIVRMSPDVREAVEALPFVRWTGPLHPTFRLAGPLRQEILTGAESTRRYTIMVLEKGADMKGAVADRITRIGGRIDQLYPEGYMLHATLTLNQLAQVARFDEVLFVDPWSDIEEDMDVVRDFGGANYVESVAGYTGQGVRAEVCDDGVNATHTDFQNINMVFHPANSSDNDHGTPVSGIVFGDGTTDPSGRGLMPDAELFIFCANSQLGNRYTHTAELADPNGPYQAVFQTNSWGFARTFFYTNDSADLDNILFDHDFLITQSQSNAGNQDSRPQAWAKNIVSVGGFFHQNTLSEADDCWCSGASTGPADDGRIKPDLSAFYDSTWATSHTSNTDYRNFGGTSGATPIVAGHFGLMFQMWSDGIFGNPVSGGSVFDERPHMTTAKALMINTAAQKPFTGQADDMTRTHQGWGQPDLQNLYDRRNDLFVIDETDILAEFGSTTYQVTLDGTEPEFHVTMTFADPPGNPAASVARVNDLSLRVTAPGGQIYWGNNGLLDGTTSTPGGVSNTVDTVENVIVDNPAAGLWTVEVIADEINQDGHVETPQLDADYALVVQGGTVTPPTLVISLPSGFDQLVAPGVAPTLDVMIQGFSQNVVAGSEQLMFRSDGGTFTSATLTPLGGDQYSVALPASGCSTMPEFYLVAQGDGGATVTLPSTAPAAVFSYDIGQVSTLVQDDFETDTGWTVDNVAITDGAWERGIPAGGGARNDPPTDFDGSGQCWVTDNVAGNSDVDGGPTRLLSPIFDLSGSPEAMLTYAQWFSSTGSPPNQSMPVEISDNGGATWTLIEDAPSTSSWSVRSWRVADFVTPTNQVRVRFSPQDNPNTSIVEAGLDDFRIESIGCCRVDLDGDGFVNTQDFIIFLNLYNAGDLAADFDGSGFLNTQDFVTFLNEFVAGC